MAGDLACAAGDLGSAALASALLPLPAAAQGLVCRGVRIEHPSARFEAEYEALIANRVILTPSIEIDLPLTDDAALDQGAFAPKIEIVARLSYDRVNRLVAPHVEVRHERLAGGSAVCTRRAGEDVEALFPVVGARVIF